MLVKSTKEKKIFVGVSWPYASGNIHIGHLAGQYVTCDVFARYHRLKGNKVLMVSGSDSHGAAVELAAKEENISPKELAERSHVQITDTYKKLNFLYNTYTSTMTENHKEVVQNIFLMLKEQGYLFVKKSMQYYDPEVKQFLPDRFVKGTCPKCQNTNARGDECPECGEFLNPEDLLEPYSVLSDKKPVLKETEHFYIDLAKGSKKLEAWVDEAGKNWRKWVFSSTKGMIKLGLEPRPITRDLKFGIQVPLEGWEEKRIYVWLEAVIGYLSASIECTPDWEDFWKDPKCKHYYFIAGGNVPFHTIIWPSELIAYNEKYLNEEDFKNNLLPHEKLQEPLNLPFDVPANKILMYKGKKISKGDKTGTTLEYLMDNYDPDLIRYFCARYAPENHDREFVWKDFIDANNNELVANLGNFVNRVLTFTATKFEKKIPEGTLEVENEIENAFNVCGIHIEKCEFVKATEAILDLGHFANKYFNDKQPWEDVKSNPTSAENTIYNSMQLVNAIRILIKPFMPSASEKIAEMINLGDEYDPNAELAEKGKIENLLNSWVFTSLDANHEIQEPSIIFAKLEYSENLEQQDSESEKDIAVSKGRDVHVTVDENLKDIPVLSRTFNDLKIKKKSPKVKKWVNDLVEKSLKKYSGESWKDDEIFTKHSELQRMYSEEENLVSSSENLIDILKEKGSLPNINTFVDIYNAVSALTGVSMGAHDIANIVGDVSFKVLEKNVKFEIIGSKETKIAKEGEYAYVDEFGIICRLDVKQSDRTKISNKTADVLVILQGNESVSKDDLMRAMNLLEEGLDLIKD